MRFKIANGQGAIYDETVSGDNPLTDPLDHLDLLKWHNELEHIGIVEVRDYSVNLPATSAYSPPRQVTHVLDTHDQASEPFVYGYITLPDHSVRPFAMHAILDSAPYNSSLAGIAPHAFTRNVSLGIDGDDIVLHEWARSNYWAPPGYDAITIGVRVFITDLSLTNLANPTPPSPNTDFIVNSTRVQLGPFDGDKEWLHIAAGSEQFPLINGVTMDAEHTRTNWRYRIPASSAFAFTLSHGGSAPAVNTATAEDIDA